MTRKQVAQDFDTLAEPEGVERSDPWNEFLEGKRALDISEYPSALFLRMANVVHASTTASYAQKHKLTAPEWRILARLCVSSPMQMATLCSVSYFDKAHVSRVVKSLVSRGFAESHPQENFPNRRLVTITPAGREYAERVFPDALEAQSRVLQILSEEERRMAFDIVWKILRAHGVEPPLPAEYYKEKEQN